MSVRVDIPSWLKALVWPYPEADVDGLHRIAQALQDARDGLLDVAGLGGQDVRDVLTAVQGMSAEDFARYWAQFTPGDATPVGELVWQCESLRDYVQGFATDVEATDISIDIQLLTLAIQISWELFFAPVAGGLSVGAAVASVFGARLIVARLVGQLLEAVAMFVLPDLIAQRIRMAGGGSWEWSDFWGSLESAGVGMTVGTGLGVVSSLVGGVLGKRLGAGVGAVLSKQSVVLDADAVSGIRVVAGAGGVLAGAVNGSLTSMATEKVMNWIPQDWGGTAGKPVDYREAALSGALTGAIFAGAGLRTSNPQVPRGSWTIVDGKMLDGDGGVWVRTDSGTLYRFQLPDGYASSGTGDGDPNVVDGSITDVEDQQPSGNATPSGLPAPSTNADRAADFASASGGPKPDGDASAEVVPVPPRAVSPPEALASTPEAPASSSQLVGLGQPVVVEATTVGGQEQAYIYPAADPAGSVDTTQSLVVAHTVSSQPSAFVTPAATHADTLDQVSLSQTLMTASPEGASLGQRETDAQPSQTGVVVAHTQAQSATSDSSSYVAVSKVVPEPLASTLTDSRTDLSQAAPVPIQRPDPEKSSIGVAAEKTGTLQTPALPSGGQNSAEVAMSQQVNPSNSDAMGASESRSGSFLALPPLQQLSGSETPGAGTSAGCDDGLIHANALPSLPGTGFGSHAKDVSAAIVKAAADLPMVHQMPDGTYAVDGIGGVVSIKAGKTDDGYVAQASRGPGRYEITVSDEIPATGLLLDDLVRRAVLHELVEIQHGGLDSRSQAAAVVAAFGQDPHTVANTKVLVDVFEHEVPGTDRLSSAPPAAGDPRDRLLNHRYTAPEVDEFKRWLQSAGVVDIPGAMSQVADKLDAIVQLLGKADQKAADLSSYIAGYPVLVDRFGVPLVRSVSSPPVLVDRFGVPLVRSVSSPPVLVDRFGVPLVPSMLPPPVLPQQQSAASSSLVSQAVTGVRYDWGGPNSVTVINTTTNMVVRFQPDLRAALSGPTRQSIFDAISPSVLLKRPIDLEVRFTSDLPIDALWQLRIGADTVGNVFLGQRPRAVLEVSDTLLNEPDRVNVLAGLLTLAGERLTVGAAHAFDRLRQLTSGTMAPDRFCPGTTKVHGALSPGDIARFKLLLLTAEQTDSYARSRLVDQLGALVLLDNQDGCSSRRAAFSGKSVGHKYLSTAAKDRPLYLALLGFRDLSGGGDVVETVGTVANEFVHDSDVNASGTLRGTKVLGTYQTGQRLRIQVSPEAPGSALYGRQGSEWRFLDLDIKLVDSLPDDVAVALSASDLLSVRKDASDFAIQFDLTSVLANLVQQIDPKTSSLFVSDPGLYAKIQAQMHVVDAALGWASEMDRVALTHLLIDLRQRVGRNVSVAPEVLYAIDNQLDAVGKKRRRGRSQKFSVWLPAPNGPSLLPNLIRRQLGAVGSTFYSFETNPVVGNSETQSVQSLGKNVVQQAIQAVGDVGSANVKASSATPARLAWPTDPKEPKRWFAEPRGLGTFSDPFQKRFWGALGGGLVAGGIQAATTSQSPWIVVEEGENVAGEAIFSGLAQALVDWLSDSTERKAQALYRYLKNLQPEVRRNTLLESAYYIFATLGDRLQRDPNLSPADRAELLQHVRDSHDLLTALQPSASKQIESVVDDMHRRRNIPGQILNATHIHRVPRAAESYTLDDRGLPSGVPPWSTNMLRVFFQQLASGVQSTGLQLLKAWVPHGGELWRHLLDKDVELRELSMLINSGYAVGYGGIGWNSAAAADHRDAYAAQQWEAGWDLSESRKLADEFIKYLSGAIPASELPVTLGSALETAGKHPLLSSTSAAWGKFWNDRRRGAPVPVDPVLQVVKKHVPALFARSIAMGAGMGGLALLGGPALWPAVPIGVIVGQWLGAALGEGVIFRPLAPYYGLAQHDKEMADAAARLPLSPVELAALIPLLLKAATEADAMVLPSPARHAPSPPGTKMGHGNLGDFVGTRAYDIQHLFQPRALRDGPNRPGPIVLTPTDRNAVRSLLDKIKWLNPPPGQHPLPADSTVLHRHVLTELRQLGLMSDQAGSAERWAEVAAYATKQLQVDLSYLDPLRKLDPTNPPTDPRGRALATYVAQLRNDPIGQAEAAAISSLVANDTIGGTTGRMVELAGPLLRLDLKQGSCYVKLVAGQLPTGALARLYQGADDLWHAGFGLPAPDPLTLMLPDADVVRPDRIEAALRWTLDELAQQKPSQSSRIKQVLTGGPPSDFETLWAPGAHP